MKNDQDRSLRRHLIELLKGGSAHARFEEAIAGIPAKLRGQKPAGLPHSPWMLLEHMRIAQWDILEFSRNRKHVSPDWPKGYWPRTEAPPSALCLECQHQEISPGFEVDTGPGCQSEN